MAIHPETKADLTFSQDVPVWPHLLIIYLGPGLVWPVPCSDC